MNKVMNMNGEKKQNGQKQEDHNENPVSRFSKSPMFIPIMIMAVIVILAGSIYYIALLNSRVSIENSQITAPIISIGPKTSGILDKVYVSEGDEVGKLTKLASVNGEMIYPKVHGIIVSVNNVPGQLVNSQSTIVQMIDPTQLQVIGRVDEDKGLKDIKPGQNVEFTVDAFPGKKFTGIVDHVSPISRQSDIVFSISDKRQINQFNVHVNFNYEKYPELKSGMSAKMIVYK
jgi:multidrug resistance efflux pump